jgi:REP-associated tyrosine transposase
VIRDTHEFLVSMALQRGQLNTDKRFADQVERITGHRIEHRAPGNRPRKSPK